MVKLSIPSDIENLSSHEILDKLTQTLDHSLNQAYQDLLKNQKIKTLAPKESTLLHPPKRK
jgi:uncharacterized protein YecT (DUF1311 family)